MCLLGAYELTEARGMGSRLRARQCCPGGVTSAGPEYFALTALLCASQPAPPAGSVLVPPTRMGSQTAPKPGFPRPLVLCPAWPPSNP